MQRKDQALELFAEKFNCSQAVFTAFRNVEALDKKSALKLSTVFGGGVACTGSEVCGAVTGGLLALSMQYGKDDNEDKDAAPKTYEVGRRLMSGFTQEMGLESCRCEVVLGLNLSVPEDLEKAREEKLFETRCVKAISVVSNLLEGLLPQKA